MPRLLPSLVLALLCAGTASRAGAQESAGGRVHVLTLDGSINPASAAYVVDGIRDASGAQAAAVVLELDTPGGLLSATRDLVGAMLASPVPVLVYVTPRGAQAASAGVFITLAAHRAAMAPGTNIGAAHPVASGNESGADTAAIMMVKATNDAAAFARSIARQRGRNADWAERAVRASVALTETEAQREGVVDLVARDLHAFLRAVDGDTVETSVGARVLQLRAAPLESRPMPAHRRLLVLLADPTVAYILLMLGIYGLFFEMSNPGAIFPGVFGGISLLLGLYAMQALPVNYAALALIGFGIVLFLLEVKIVSHGLLGIGGAAAVFLGSIMLIDAPPGLAFLRISLPVIIAFTLCSAAFFLLVVGKGLAVLRRMPSTGVEGMRGLAGTALEPLDPAGRVSVRGEIWNALSESGPVPGGGVVVVRGMRGLTLLVDAQTPTHTAQS